MSPFDQGRLEALIAFYTKRVARNRQRHLTEVHLPIDEMEVFLELAACALGAIS